jgi:hypothetical protein
MKNYLLFLGLVVLSFKAFPQTPYEFECEIVDEYVIDSTKSVYMPYGGVHTPKGQLHGLVIFVKFNDSDIQDIPSWAQGADNGVFNSDAANIGNTLNISHYYKAISNQNDRFLFTGDIFPEVVPVDYSVNYPTTWTKRNEVNEAVFNWINNNHPNFNWGKYDNRTNWPGYSSDNSTSSSDGKIDYIVIVYLRGPNLHAAASTYGTHPVTTNYSGTTESFTITDGYTITQFNNSESGFRNLFYHEFAHHLYNSPHYFGANGVVGHKFFNTRGWGMMQSGSSTFNSANAWERWLLDWIELDANGVNSDIESVADLPQNGTFVLRDFVETGDVVRIKIPSATNQYVWLENRTGTTIFDNRDGYNTNGAGNPLPQAPNGLVMFVERILDDKTIGLSSSNYDYVNGLSVIHKGGNWDFSHSGNFTTPDEWWGNKC